MKFNYKLKTVNECEHMQKKCEIMVNLSLLSFLNNSISLKREERLD